MNRLRTGDCLNRERLKLFALGMLPSGQREIAAEHLAICPDCVAIIAELGDVPDRMISALRESVAQDSFAAEPDCRRMIERVLRVSSQLRQAKAVAPRDDNRADDRPNDESLRRTDSSHALSTPSAGVPAGTESIPEQFGRYKIIRTLGSGGMGTVYLAHDTHLGRDVALKIPRFSANSGREILERFNREARSAATIDHPNICQCLEALSHDN